MGNRLQLPPKEEWKAVKTLWGLSCSSRALSLFPLKLLWTAGSGEGKKAAITLRGVKERLTEHRIPPQSTRTPFRRTKTTKNRVVYQLIVEKHQVAHVLSLPLSLSFSSSPSAFALPVPPAHPLLVSSVGSPGAHVRTQKTQFTHPTDSRWKAPWLALFERHPSPSVLALVSSYFTGQINNSATSMDSC